MIEEILWKLLTWKKASIVFLLCGMFRDSEKTAIRLDEKQFGIVADHLQNWIDPMFALMKRYPLEKWGLLEFTFGELFADLMIIVFSVAGGAYFNAARSMRSVFESMIHAAYVGERYPWYPSLIDEAIEQGITEETFDKHVRSRLQSESSLATEEIKRITTFKVSMIDDLELFNSEEKIRLFRLYDRLSQLVHPSPLKLKKYTEDAALGVTFFYDSDFFGQCVGLLDETMDLVMSVLLVSFQEIRSELKSQKYVYESLARLPITSRLLESNQSQYRSTI